MGSYWLTQGLLSGIAWSYLVFLVGALLMAVLIPRSWIGRSICVCLVLALFSILPWKVYRSHEREKAELAQQRANSELARARYLEKCRTAGVKIYRTVPDVEGFKLLKIRRRRAGETGQFDFFDPYGDDYTGDAYIRSMLRGRDEAGKLQETSLRNAAYAFVLFRDDKTQEWREAHWTPNSTGEMEFQVMAPKHDSRYAVDYADISTLEDRKLWIAGSRLSVVDLETGEVLAERIGWMVDGGQGMQIGGRSPWYEAAVGNSCPPRALAGSRMTSTGQTRNFVESVLIPKGGDYK